MVYTNTSGELILYSNGPTVWNGNGQTLENGTVLIKNQEANYPGLIVPIPGSDNRFLLFSVDETEGNTDPATVTFPIYYHEIDMNAAAGRGAVVSGKKLLLKESSFALTAVKHCNNKAYWLIAHEGKSDGFLVYLIDENGIHIDDVQTYRTGTRFNRSSVGLQQEIVASEDGKLIAVSKPVSPEGGFVETFPFNNETGEVGKKIVTLKELGKIKGIALSPSGKFVFVSRFTTQTSIDESTYSDTYELVQFRTSVAPTFREVLATNTYRGRRGDDPDSQFLVEPGVYGNLKLAPNGKIYLAHVDDSYLSVVNNPDETGPAVNFQYRGFSLGSRKSKAQLPATLSPDYPEIKAKVVFEGDSLLCNPKLKAETGTTPQTDMKYQWYRDQKLLEGQNSATIKVTQPGDYQVFVIRECSQVLSPKKAIKAGESPEKPISDSTITICTGNELPTLNLYREGLKWYLEKNLQLAVKEGPAFVPQIGTLTPSKNTYFVTVTEKGCESEASSITLEVLDNQPITLKDSLLFECFNGTNETFPVYTNEKIPPVTWFKDGDFYSEDTNPAIKEYGLYEVRKQDQRCPSSDNIVVKEACIDLYLPGAFTPNNDGINDELILFGSGKFTFDFQLTDRNNRILLNLKNQQFDNKQLILWDGKAAQSPVAEGLFYYLLKARGIFDGVEREQTLPGQITLLR